MRGFTVFAFVVAALCVYTTNADDDVPREFDEVRVCLADLSRINNENKNPEAILQEALYENLYRALACVEVLADLEEMELTSDQEKELMDWQAEMEKENVE